MRSLIFKPATFGNGVGFRMIGDVLGSNSTDWTAHFDPQETFKLEIERMVRVVARTSLVACRSPEPQIVARELADRSAAHQLHVALYLGLHQV